LSEIIAALEFANDISPTATGGTTVTVYSDEGGRKVAHVVKKASSTP
jgi:hypothetical protein